jgi:hypothetical protein
LSANASFKSAGGSEQLLVELFGVIDELALDHAAAKATADHQRLKRRQLLCKDCLARERLQDADQPATASLTWRNLLDRLGSFAFGAAFGLPFCLSRERSFGLRGFDGLDWVSLVSPTVSVEVSPLGTSGTG